MKRAEAGFTLTELIMVVVILGVLAVAAIPIINNFVEAWRPDAARMIQANLRYAEELAVTSNRHTRIAFNVAGNSYTITQETSAGSGTYANIANPATKENPFTVDFDTLSEFQGITISAVSFDGQTTLEFDSLGRPYSVSGSTPTLLAANGSITLNGALTITVTKNTGLVSF